MRLAGLNSALPDGAEARGDSSARAFGGRRLVILVALMAASLALRLPGLGGVFEGSDSVELAARVLVRPGYGWMLHEAYGFLINFVVKVFVGAVSSLGITVTEFWWKLPVAVVGSLQAPLAYLFLRRLRCGEAGAMFGSLALAVLPIHVMQSRYLWGYEVLGAFFVTVAVWALLDFLESPGMGRAAVASVCSALYLMSHNYIVPFPFCILALAALFTVGVREPVARRVGWGLHLLVSRFVWVGPLLCLFIYRHALAHGLTKGVRPGLFLWDHLPGFVGNTGWPLALVCTAAAVGSVALRGPGRKPALLLALCGAFYLAPLFFLAPPGVTVVRGYMLVGAVFWVLCAAVVFDEAVRRWRRAVLSAGAVILAVTMWGTVESVFFADQLLDPARVTVERGGVTPDPCTKAAGYLVQKYVPPGATVLAVHRAVEPSNLIYYFRRERYAYYDLTLEMSLARLRAMKGRADVVVCEAAHVGLMEADAGFLRKAVLLSGGRPRMWIYARPHVALPEMRADVRDLDRAFDREFSWKVRLW